MRRGRATAVLLTLLVAVLTLTGCQKLKARDELNKGVRAYKDAQFNAAIEHFQEAIKLDPQLINARVYLAIAYASQFVPGSPAEANQRMGEAAIKAFEDVLQLDPGNITSLSYMASLHLNIGATQKTIEEIRPWLDKAKQYRRRLMELEPRKAEHPYSVGVYDWTLTYRPRMELRNKMGLLRPEQPIPRREREQLAEQNSAFVDEGIQMLQQALKLDPEYADAMAYLNLMYREKADLAASADEREAWLKQADDLAERASQILQRKRQAPAPSS